MFGYNETNRWHDQYFGKAVTVAADGTDTEQALAVGAHGGALAVCVAAAGGPADAQDLCLCLLEADTPEGPFEPKADGPTVMVTGTFEDRAPLMEVMLPDCKPYVKVHLEGGLTGTADVFLTYIPR